MSTIKVDTWQDRAGTQEFYACRAWVNFNGTGTVAIRESGNVSSITDNGAGDYTVNFTTAITDANYAAPTSVGRGLTAADSFVSTKTTTSYTIEVVNQTGSAFVDTDGIEVAVFR